MTTPAFTVKESLVFGWNAFKARPWFFVGTIVAYAIVQIVLGALQEQMPGIVSMLLSLVVSTLLYAGLINIYLKAHESPQAPSWNDYWNPKPFWSYLGVSLLLLVIVGIGLVLLIIPGVFLAVMLSMAGFLVVDKGLNPIAALKESARLTKGNRWKLLLLGLVLFVLTVLGMIPLLLGLLVVGPVSMLASVHVYRALERAAGSAPVVAASAPVPSEVGS